MMNYVRRLTAGNLPWKETIQEWLDQAEDLLAGRGPAAPAERSYDLMALHGKLARVDPDRLGEVDSRGTTAALNAACTMLGCCTLRGALARLDLPGWEEAVDEYAAAFEAGDLPDDEATRRAVDLLEDLDDAEMVALRAGDSMRADIDRCIRTLVRNGLAFLPVSVTVQAIVFSFRQEQIPALAASARKFVHLLEMFEEVEADLLPPEPWDIQ